MAEQVPFRGMTIDQAYAVADGYYKEALARAEQYRERNQRDVDLVFQAAALLDAAGFEVPVISNYNCTGFHLDIERGDLQRVYGAVGRLKLDGKDIVDCKKRTIRVSLKAAEYPCITFCYVTKLPRKAKCKIVTCRQKAYRYKTLVCEAS
jgi:hypothetical protein